MSYYIAPNVTQSPFDNSTNPATTAYADALFYGGGLYWSEDWISAGNSTVGAGAVNVQGDHAWLCLQITAGTTGTVAAGNGTWLNPGQIVLTTPATATNGIAFYVNSNANAPFGILGANAGWQNDFFEQTGATITTQAIRIGFSVAGGEAADAPTGGIFMESDTSNASNVGGALTAGAITGGTLYTTGTYTNVPITGGSGTGALATVVVAGGAVTTVTFTTAGNNYKGGDTGLSASAANIGGTGSGFSFPLAAGIGPGNGITQNWNLRTINASTSSYVDTGVTLAASTWYHGRATSPTAGTIALQIGVANGALGTAVTSATNVDTTHAMMATIQLVARANAARVLTMDKWSFVANPGRV